MEAKTMDWSQEAIATLRALWDEGHSTAEIGRRMGVSKNAIVGKAHRLNLPARPSPIRRDGPAAPRAASPRPQAPRALPPARPMIAPPPRPAIQAPPPAPAPQPVVRAFPRLGTRSCCWPIGEPGTAGFRFCTSEAILAKPYCPEHAAMAYVKPRDRREDAA
jgi:GcrA cell cycle regulator